MAVNPTSNITWDAFLNADSYEVAVVGNDGDMNVEGAVAIAQESIIINSISLGVFGLTESGAYRVQVRALIGVYKTAWSPAAPFTFSPDYPGVVANVQVS